MWHLFSDYQKLNEFCTNLSVTNDVAEWGVRMIMDYLNCTQDETQHQALLQTVEAVPGVGAVPELCGNWRKSS